MNPPGRCRVNIFGYIPPPCAAPPAWRYPTGFAGVSYATVSGLVVGWLAVVEVVDAGVVECVVMGVGSGWCRCRGLCVGLLPRPLPGVTPPASPVCPSPQSRGWLWCGRCVAYVWPLPVSMVCSTRVFDVVGVADGRGVGRHRGRRRCRWCELRGCSRLWAWLLVEGWVVTCPVRAPCPALPNRLRRSVLRHCVGAGCWVVVALPAGGRGCCR